MTAKPTDGLLGCLATGRAGNLDLGIIKRTFGDDAFLSENLAKANSMTSSPVAVYRHACDQPYSPALVTQNKEARRGTP
jgi:hypothetical protein